MDNCSLRWEKGHLTSYQSWTNKNYGRDVSIHFTEQQRKDWPSLCLSQPQHPGNCSVFTGTYSQNLKFNSFMDDVNVNNIHETHEYLLSIFQIKTNNI